MNTLSWLLYAADVAGSLGEMVFAGFVCCILACVVAAFVFFCSLEDHNDAAIDASKRIARIFGTWAVILFLIQAVVPSQKTIYLIAASEMGEEIIMTPEMEKLRDVLNDQLDGLLDEEDE